METKNRRMVEPWMWCATPSEGDGVCNIGWPVRFCDLIWVGRARGNAVAASWAVIWPDGNNEPKSPEGIDIISLSWIRFVSPTLALTAKDAQSVVETWMQDALPPNGNIWVWGKRQSRKGLLRSLIHWGVVTDVLEIRQRRTDLEGKDWFCSRSNFERFRYDLYRKEKSRCQNLVPITADMTCEEIK